MTKLIVIMHSQGFTVTFTDIESNRPFTSENRPTVDPRISGQDFDDVTLPRYGNEANKSKKKNKKSKENSSPSKKAKLSKSKDKKGKKKSRPVPVESDAVSEGDLLDEEEAGVPSQRPPKMNGKKSKERFPIRHRSYMDTRVWRQPSQCPRNSNRSKT